MKLLRVGLFEAVQFPQPVGVQKTIATGDNTQRPAIIRELANGDLEVRAANAMGLAQQHVVIVPRENVAHKLYQVEPEDESPKGRGASKQTKSSSGDRTK